MLIFRCTLGTFAWGDANLIRLTYNPIYLMAANTPAHGKRNKLKTLWPGRVAQGPRTKNQGPKTKVQGFSISEYL